MRSFAYGRGWHPATGALTARPAEDLGRHVEAFFFTPAGCQGLAVHRDDADVFVLQTARLHPGPGDETLQEAIDGLAAGGLWPRAG